MKCKAFFKGSSTAQTEADINEWLKTEPYIQIHKIQKVEKSIFIFYYTRKDKLKKLEGE